MSNNQFSEQVKAQADLRRTNLALAGDLLSTEVVNKSDRLFAMSLMMGDVPSFLVTRPLSWVAEHIQFAATLPIYEEKNRNPGMRIDVNRETASFIFQRQPNWSRQFEMTKYLADQDNHKFPPLLVIAYQDWIPDQKDPFEKMSLCITPIGKDGIFHEINTEGTTFCVIDGQHRLMAILGLRDLVVNGHLSAKKEDGAETPSNPRNRFTRDELMANIRRKNPNAGDDAAIMGKINSLMNETIGIEIIPVSLKGETWPESTRRIRSAFLDVNKNAKKTTNPQELLLEDKNGYVVVAQNVAFDHGLLMRRVELIKDNLAPNSERYTTLRTLAEMSRHILCQIEPFDGWKQNLKQRPSAAELEQGIKILSEFFDGLEKLPSHKDMKQGGDVHKLRESQQGNILFRPIAQQALAEAIGALVADKNIAVSSVMKAIASQEKNGKLRLTDKCSPWYGVLYDPVNKNMRRQKHFAKLCCALFYYLLGGKLGDDKRKQLQGDFAEARRVSADAPSADGARYLMLDGDTLVSDPKMVALPDPWYNG